MWISLLLIILVAVNAQLQACSESQATATVSDYDSANSLAAACTSLAGSLEISSSASEDIVLDGMVVIGGDLTCEGASGDGFTALSSSTLSEIHGQMKLGSVSWLTSVEFEKLNSVYGLEITSNVALQTLDFPTLMYSFGSVELTGNFSSIRLPELKHVNGSFQLTSATNFDCSAFDNDDVAGVYQGKYSCSGLNATTQSSPTSSIIGETKKPSSVPSSILPTGLPTTQPAIQPTNTATTQAGEFTKKDKLAVGLGTGAVIVTFGIIIVVWVSWKIRKAHKEHEDIVLRTPVVLTGQMHLDHVPHREKPQEQSRYGDPRQSGLSYHEVHSELQEIHGLEEVRNLTGLEEERKKWLMEHLFLRAEVSEMEG